MRPAVTTWFARLGFAFNAHEAWAHAQFLCPELRQALAAAGLTSARRLGKWFERMQGRDLGGVRLVRIGDDYHGAVWMFVESAARTQAPHCGDGDRSA